ncbi:MAG TPA: prepilin-type N-terminal cleavage/methylation domain-containing protein [Thermoclostridium caenicola]|uniref:prepilin-type N-terminal cleavage/methylation domain-containing protein n=1 Tax=Thermoclostridium caenicola TaxID=659425 RepID=UPI002C71205D|nr:prepilin-type N-terminal cleavage/methylation domain-containing protein [Thermoclostridium caenicola]HOK42318.1 prepilin-type N-terminal cleavage/methylation domain-containing protein [Thermoclostridium caenicola]HOL84609.1 prepilin-type N-terminal cleavage/methylation domain-containing protein [Thermoclostridium caenicola]HPO76834.1 prepilin-type N-terminal cleavage/methylation domain-containing protein [Thermoclostridium caenicola]
MLKRFKKNNKGFTLVELMVVVVILGILVAIAVPIYNKTTENAERNACHANLRTIDGAKTQYAVSSGLTWPDAFFRGGIPKCPSGGTYSNTDPTDPAQATAQATCSKHGSYDTTPTPSPTP